MRKFIVGIIVGLVGVAAGVYVYVHYGYFDLRADQPPSGFERLYMTNAMDNYAGRYAPKMGNPVPPTDANLIDGIRLFKSNCAVCHGGPEKPVSGLGEGFNPPVPQFLKDAPDMPENQNYWIVKHGIKMTGMPAWDKVLSDTDIWKLVTFLSKMENLDKLSPAVQQAWKSGGQAELGAEQSPTAPGVPSSAPKPAMPRSSRHTHRLR